jgi:hypothetical protein
MQPGWILSTALVTATGRSGSGGTWRSQCHLQDGPRSPAIPRRGHIRSLSTEALVPVSSSSPASQSCICRRMTSQAAGPRGHGRVDRRHRAGVAIRSRSGQPHVALELIYDNRGPGRGVSLRGRSTVRCQSQVTPALDAATRGATRPRPANGERSADQAAPPRPARTPRHRAGEHTRSDGKPPVPVLPHSPRLHVAQTREPAPAISPKREWRAIEQGRALRLGHDLHALGWRIELHRLLGDVATDHWRTPLRDRPLPRTPARLLPRPPPDHPQRAARPRRPSDHRPPAKDLPRSQAGLPKIAALLKNTEDDVLALGVVPGDLPNACEGRSVAEGRLVG